MMLVMKQIGHVVVVVSVRVFTFPANCMIVLCSSYVPSLGAAYNRLIDLRVGGKKLTVTV